MANEQKEYFDNLEEVAKFLNLSFEELCRLRNNGGFPISPEPLDPTLVYHKATVEAWDRAGRPCRWGCLVGFDTRSGRIEPPAR